MGYECGTIARVWLLNANVLLRGLPRSRGAHRLGYISLMYAIAILRYRRPLEEVVAAVDDHRAYLKTLNEQGLLVASGPAHPRNGGMLILRVPDDDVIASLDRIRDGDPYYQRGLAQYELIPWAPTIGKDALDKM
jgi:uncharacterized protein YciI